MGRNGNDVNGQRAETDLCECSLGHCITLYVHLLLFRVIRVIVQKLRQISNAYRKRVEISGRLIIENCASKKRLYIHCIMVIITETNYSEENQW